MLSQNKSFWNLRNFGKIVIGVFFEVVCELVGSVMNQHLGKDCHLHPLYFSIEIYLRWNLGPLHFLNNLIRDKSNLPA